MARIDILGDIHGMRETLLEMLAQLGYVGADQGWSHPEGRSLVCVGDVLDCGPDPLGCVEILQTMATSGVAQLVLGNHELNALHFQDGLRQAGSSHLQQSEPTRRQMKDDPDRWQRLRAFLEDCPLHLSLDGGRLAVVHACWHPASLERLPETLGASAGLARLAPGGDLREAVEMVMKGPVEAAEPHTDARGTERRTRRVPWWLEHSTAAPFVAFGHYRFPWPGDPATPVRPGFLGLGKNATCLDYSIATGGPLVALRYPERELLSVPCCDQIPAAF